MKQTLEQRMLEAIKANGTFGTKHDAANVCAKISLDEIMKAFEAGKDYEWNSHFGPIPNMKPNLEKYLLQQNLIEKK